MKSNCRDWRSRSSLKLALFAATAAFITTTSLIADPGNNPQSAEIIEKYVSASQNQRAKLMGLQMETEIDARLPKLHKEGKMSLFRYISKVGKVSYVVRSFVGDNTVKKDFIARVLEAERQASDSNEPISITPENYKFKYKRLTTVNDRPAHIFELEPKKKKVGLFKGELWVDAETYLPLRETGRFVKNPSVFMKKAEFTRDYAIQDGVALPHRMESKADLRIVGKAEMSISYTNFSWGTGDAVISPVSDTQVQSQ